MRKRTALAVTRKEIGTLIDESIYCNDTFMVYNLILEFESSRRRIIRRRTTFFFVTPV